MLTLFYRGHDVFYSMCAIHEPQAATSWSDSEMNGKTWEKGRKAQRRFCFRLRESEEAPLHCGLAGSVMLPDKKNSKYNF